MRSLAPLALALAATPALAQGDAQLWVSGGASGTVSGPVRASIDAIARYGDQARGPYQRNVAGALGYALSKSVVVWAGYVHSVSAATGKRDVIEHRVREDLTATLGHLAGGSVTTRLRGEQRWRDDARDTGTRGRLRVTWTRPFRSAGRTAINLSHESFVNLDSTDWGQRRGYERMRNAVSLSTPLLARVKGEIGYLNQRIFVRGAPDMSDNVATLAVSVSF